MRKRPDRLFVNLKPLKINDTCRNEATNIAARVNWANEASVVFILLIKHTVDARVNARAPSTSGAIHNTEAKLKPLRTRKCCYCSVTTVAHSLLAT